MLDFCCLLPMLDLSSDGKCKGATCSNIAAGFYQDYQDSTTNKVFMCCTFKMKLDF